MNPLSRLLSVPLFAALLLAMGCASTPKSEPEPMPMKDPAPTLSRSEKGADLTPSAPSSESLAPIYFDTDQSLLREDARMALKRHGQAIQSHPEWGVVLVEGHCDERGSEEYNVALGARRADAVVRYLVDVGVPLSRLKTRTYGEERPAVAGHDERAWSRNRRSELKSESVDAALR